MALLEDARGALWVGTHGGGLARLDRETGEFARYRHRREDSHSLSSNNVTALCEDAQGVLWIGTETGGLNALDTAAQLPSFVRYQHEGGNPHSLSHDYVTTLLEDAAGTLWVGTGRGLNELDRPTKRFRQALPRGRRSCQSELQRDPVPGRGCPGHPVDRHSVGLNKFDRSTRAFGHFRREQKTPGALSSNAVTAFLEDVQGFLWIGTYGGGLNRSTTDEAMAGFVHFGHREDDPHSLGDWTGSARRESLAALGRQRCLGPL